MQALSAEKGLEPSTY